MKMSLTAGLDDQEAQDVRADFKGCPTFRKRLIHLLEKEIEALHAEMRSDDTYESPNWQLKHVERLGTIKSNKKLISLLSEKTH